MKYLFQLHVWWLRSLKKYLFVSFSSSVCFVWMEGSRLGCFVKSVGCIIFLFPSCEFITSLYTFCCRCWFWHSNIRSRWLWVSLKLVWCINLSSLLCSFSWLFHDIYFVIEPLTPPPKVTIYPIGAKMNLKWEELRKRRADAYLQQSHSKLIDFFQIITKELSTKLTRKELKT